MSIRIKREGMPKELEEVYVDFYWSKQKLWDLDVQESEIELSKLEWILDYPIWYLDANPVPNAILENPKLDEHHWQRVVDADLSYAVHVIEWKGRLLILDGVHRLMKAKIDEKKLIKAKIVKNSDIEKILPSESELDQGFLKQALK